MEHSPLVSNQFLKIYRKALLFGAVILLEYHIILGLYAPMVSHYVLLIQIECRFGFVLLIASLFYLLGIFLLSREGRPWLQKRLKSFCCFEQLFLVFYFFWFVFVVALRQHFFGQYHSEWFYFQDNNWWMFITGLIAFLIFPFAHILGNEKAETWIPVMFKLVVIPNMVFHVWILWQYLHLNFVTFPSGRTLEMDFEISMWIGENRNITGAVSVSMMTLCLYLIATQKRWGKFLYCFATAVYFIALVYSNCRTAWYSCLLVSGISCMFSVMNFMEGKQTALRIGVGLLSAIGCILFLIGTRSVLFHLLGDILRQAPVLPDAVQEFNSATAVRTYTSGLSGRMELYQACLYVMTHSRYCFLFGVTPSDIGQAVYGLYGVDVIYPHAHNFFLQMGMSYGVPTMLLTIAFVISLAIRSFRLLFRYRKKLSPGSWMIVIVVLCTVAQDMMETSLNSGSRIMTVLFYLFAGWIVELERNFRSAPD